MSFVSEVQEWLTDIPDSNTAGIGLDLFSRGQLIGITWHSEVARWRGLSPRELLVAPVVAVFRMPVGVEPAQQTTNTALRQGDA